MKRKYVFATVALAAASLAVPATAGGPNQFVNDYEGRAERNPNTYFGFDVARTNSGKKVAKVSALLGYHCVNGSFGGFYGRAQGKIKVRGRRFAGTVVGSPPPTRLARGAVDSFRYFVRGRFRRGGKARGTIDAELRFVPTKMRGAQALVRCYSGELDWRARRGADVPPPERETD